MTTVLDPVAHGERPYAARPIPAAVPRARLLSRSWPLTLLLVGFPVLWALGLAAFAVQVVAVPMAVDLVRRGRRIRVPRGFWLWCLFLVLSGAGFLLLGANPPQTVPDSLTGRLVGFGLRESSYVAITVVLLWIGNATEAELPERRVVKQLGWFFLAVTVGGVLGLLFPHASFASPLERVLPHDIATSSYVNRLVHPAFAQVQDFGGDPLPRPSAPFAYTNTWGSQLSLLAVWFVVGWMLLGRRWQRVVAPVAVLVALVTVVYSLNRGVWVGVVFTVGYVAVQLARRGRVVPFAALLIAIALGALVFVNSPLKGVFETRVDNGKSDSIRAFTSERAFELANRSPVVGYGSTRAAVGSHTSIAIGRSAGCPSCGNVAIGINGSFFTLIVTTGYGGAALFFGFWFAQGWRSRRDTGLVAVACRLTLLLATLYSFFYTVELLVPFVAIALLWRRRTAEGGGADAEPDLLDRPAARRGAGGHRLREQPAALVG